MFLGILHPLLIGQDQIPQRADRLSNRMPAPVRYVKIYLETDKAQASKRKTSVKRNTTDPVYNEVLQVMEQRASGESFSYLFSMLSFTELSKGLHPET